MFKNSSLWLSVFVSLLVVVTDQSKADSDHQDLRNQGLALQTTQSRLVHSIAANTVNANPNKQSARHRINPSTVRVEADGSLTPRSENLMDILAALNSGVGVAVNFHLEFSKNSYVLTADGRQTLSAIAAAIRYLDSSVNIDLEIAADDTGDNKLTIRRGRELVRILNSNYRLRNQIRYFVSPHADNVSSTPTAKSKSGTEAKRVTVLNLGSSG